uniref:Protein FAR-RED IMPAIRED RESPONSE 1-like n=1 Tax=Nicotiana tabacum TaxID=4097 RepID=A0A1S4BUQ9_TOBAC|nr:PREDICTED: protein FAR-RED IMPAIRED RESPONSE 1-like [Nicotiana tabacum]
MPNEFNEEDLIIGPITGMRFSSKDVMFDFYKEHARLPGFCIVKRTSNKKVGDIISYVQYGCDTSRKPRNKHVTKRRNCRARINRILEENGSWRISNVVKKHNHQLEPALSRLMVGHRSLSKSLKRTLAVKDIAGLRPSKNIRVAEVLVGGPENLGCTPKDCRNYILKSKKLQLQEGDAQSLLKFFSDMQQNDREFYCSVDVDSFGQFRNVVWVHSHSKVAYEEFHDVICLDTTYLVNRYNMPFASFAGVNQYRQSILLGCALMSSEDITSYKMVLSTWLGAQNNVHPLAIMTDQCDSIKAVINALMPNTVHRYCIWHIFAKLPTKLSRVLDDKIAKAEFKALVLDSINIAIGAKFEKELEAEYEPRCFEPKCLSEFAWEEKFQTCYTREVFEFFQVQLRKLYHCEISTPEDHQATVGVENYIIADYSFRSFNTRDPFVFTVEYTPIGEYLSCNCKWFEIRGDGSGVRGNMRGRGGGRGVDRGGGRSGSRGGGRGGGKTGLAEGIEQDDATVPPHSSLPDLNDEANWEIEDLTV